MMPILQDRPSQRRPASSSDPSGPADDDDQDNREPAVLAAQIPADARLAALSRICFEPFAETCFRLLNPRETLGRNWHLSAIAGALQDVEEGRCARLLITVPPRHMKTLYASIAFPAWAIGRQPGRRVICASYGQELSLKISRSYRDVVSSAWYRRVFPKASELTRTTEVELANASGGYRYATAVGGTVTGLGADIVIIDDLMKAADAPYPEARERAKRFIDETLLSRLNDHRVGAVIAIQQRLHEDDPAAYLMDKSGYRHLNLPAIAVEDQVVPLSLGRLHRRRVGDLLNPERQPRAVLDRLRAEMGDRAFEAQYQQNPTVPGGAHIRWDRIQTYDEPPEREALRSVVQCWDVAYTTGPQSDYSVCSTWGHDGTAWLLLDVVRVRLEYTELLARARTERDRWKADVILVERGSVGHPLLRQLRSDFHDRRRRAPRSNPEPVAFFCPSVLGKLERMSAQAERLYTGAAKFPSQAPWVADLRRELCAFPDGRHDDQVDSISHFLEWSRCGLARKRAGEVPLRPIGTRRGW